MLFHFFLWASTFPVPALGHNPWIEYFMSNIVQMYTHSQKKSQNLHLPMSKWSSGMFSKSRTSLSELPVSTGSLITLLNFIARDNTEFQGLPDRPLFTGLGTHTLVQISVIYRILIYKFLPLNIWTFYFPFGKYPILLHKQYNLHYELVYI